MLSISSKPQNSDAAPYLLEPEYRRVKNSYSFRSAENRRKQLESQLSKANDELTDLASAEQELAIVEDDLIRFDPPKARESFNCLIWS